MTAAAPPAEPIGAFKLAGILIRFKLRSFRNAFRGSTRRRSPLFVAAVVLAMGLAYAALFTQAFAIIARNTDIAGQIAALALILGTSTLGSLAARAASNEAVRAGSPENEFLLARPMSLASLVTARGLADAVTDPVGGLFLLPVLIAAALTWHVGWAACPIIIATSMLVQVAISMLAYAVQLAAVRYVAPVRRRGLWTGLRLIAALSLASLWMLASWVLRAPAALAGHLGALAPAIELSPAALLAAPLAGLARGEPGAAVLALAVLAVVAVCAMLVAAAVARRAGMYGWEEAGAVWADVAVSPRPGARPPTAATKDLRLIARDTPQLLALIAMPAIFVGVQIFGAAGWDWTTGSIGRVACLAYSLSLYMATIGPLTHMQAERRAFWILRSVRVPLGQLFAAKARAWAMIVGATAAIVFVAFSAWMPDVPMLARLATGFLVVVGAVIMSFVAVAMAAAGADLADDHVTAVGPTTIYSFVLVGGLYNLVLVEDTPVRGAGLVLYAFACWSYWRAGIEHGLVCMDAEAGRKLRRRASDGATMLLLYALGARALGQGAAKVGMASEVIAFYLRLALLAIVGAFVVIYLARRPRAAAGHLSPVASAGVGLGAGALAGVVMGWLGGGAWLSDLGGGVWLSEAADTRAPALIGALAMLAEELLYRGVIQDGIEQEVAYRPGRIWVGRIGAATVTTALAGTVAVLWAQAWQASALLPMLASIVASHGAASLTRAATGRTAPAFLARVAALAVATFAGGVVWHTMIAMRVLLFSRAPVVLAAASLLVLSCGVDETGLNQKPFLPHDAAAIDAAGVAGSAGGASGTAGAGGTTPSGVAGAGGAVSGVAGDGSAGDAGTAGVGGGTPGTGGTTGVAGDGAAGTGTTTGLAGMGGDSGVAGAAGSGVAGMGGSVGVGGNSVAGMGGSGPAGIGGGAVAGRGGASGGGAGGRGGAAGGGGRGGAGVCNQLNCNDGCCDGGTCIRQRTAQKCGSGGQACAACGGCQLCTTMGLCRIDSASRWKIIAVSATLSGGGWDRNFGDLGGSAPDPFCEFENPAGQVSSTTAGVTDTIIDDPTAVWNQEITPPGMTVAASTLMANNPTWQIWVGDDDDCNSPQGCLGDIACTYQSAISEAALRAGELTISNRMSCTSLKLQFVCQAPLASE